jgi:hypothetical protein
VESLIYILATGLGAGLGHVYMGADHLAALMPISHSKRWRAGWLGMRWGLGHSFGVILVALAFVVLRESLGSAIDFDAVGTWGERFVGAMLIALGLHGVHLALRDRARERDTAQPASDTPIHRHAAIGAGVLHGVAGMAHLWGVLPSLALPWTGSVAYLLGFALGSMLAMGAFAAFFGVLTARLGEKAPRLVTASRVFASGVCALIGVVWLAMPPV